jgi:bifunctional non-homologous end joining protein LigD
MKERSAKPESIGACFIEPMLCLAVDKLPEGPPWEYEVKLDGYRAIAVRTKAGVELWLRTRSISRDVSRISRALWRRCRSRLFRWRVRRCERRWSPAFQLASEFRRRRAGLKLGSVGQNKNT